MVKIILMSLVLLVSLNLAAEIKIQVPSVQKNIKVKQQKAKPPKAKVKTKVTKKTKIKLEKNNYVSFDQINKTKILSSNINKFIKTMRVTYTQISQLNPEMSHEYILDLKLPLILDQLESYKSELSWHLNAAIEYANCQRDCQEILINLSLFEENQKALLNLISNLSDKTLLADETFDLRIQTEKIKYLKAEYEWIKHLKNDLIKVNKAKVINSCEGETLTCNKFLLVGGLN